MIATGEVKNLLRISGWCANVQKGSRFRHAPNRNWGA